MKCRASAAYEKAKADLENMSDPAWHTLLRSLLIEYVTLITNPEGPAQSAPTMTRKEFLERDAARKDACTAAIAAAAAANPDDDGEVGGAGDGDFADGDSDEADDASGPAAKAGRGTGRGREGGRAKKSL